MSDAPSPPPSSPYEQTTQLSPADEKLWAMLVHLGGIFFGFIPSLIGYLVLKDRGPFVRAHTATALNFQISFTIYAIVLIPISIITLGIGSILYLPLTVLIIVFSIIAAVKANQGQPYTYPLSIKFVS